MNRNLRYSLDIAAFVLLFIALVIPDRISWITFPSLAYFPLELLVLGLALLVPGRAGTLVLHVAAVLLAAGIIFKLADMAAYQVYARPFNPVFDAYLLGAGMNLLTGAIGRPGALLVAALLCVLVVGILVVAHAVLGRMQNLLWRRPVISGRVLLVALLVWGVLDLGGWRRTSTYFVDLMTRHARDTLSSLADIRSFRTVAAVDGYQDVPGDMLFGRLQGKDVLVVFVESYGRVVLDNPDFARHVRPVLEKGSADLAADGLFVRSSYLTSPTVGGLSWLAHGTVLSGLWIDSQVRYDSLMMSERPSLNRLFGRAGWRTVAVMPAITRAWPEGQYFGYDQIYGAQDLGYQGLPFNWVTMPDQYVLSAFEARERQGGPRAPVMAEIALISSHAPWTPIPQLIAWDAVGDGSVFNEQASAGATPEEVWRDTARIRVQYRRSIEYAIANLVSYALAYGDENLVMLIIGDHQPAPLVTGDTANRDVPVHLIARDPAVIAAIADWQWSDGLLPDADAPVWRMDVIRDRFIASFSIPQASAAHEAESQ